MEKSNLLWQDSLGEHFFDFLNNGKGFTESENEMLELIYITSHLQDELFISFIETLKGRPEYLDEYFYSLLLFYDDMPSDKAVYELRYDTSDCSTVFKYKYHFTFTAEYALDFFGVDGFGHIKRIAF